MDRERSAHAELAAHAAQGVKRHAAKNHKYIRGFSDRAQVGGSTRRAAEILGISTRKIQYRLNEYRERDPSGVPVVARRDATA